MSLRRSLTASVVLSILFVAVYGACNWFTSRRTDVGTFYFEWERALPFVPFMVVPYLSIDLFFIAAPFICRSDRELWTFSRRVIAAITVAGICFLLFPFRFAFERPRIAGWLGLVFDWFRQMDHPYNLLPSLHITLRTFLASLYARHTTGFLRGASNTWFSLIGLSTLLTYQHHVLDLAGGFALAGYCFYFFPERPWHRGVTPNRRIGICYAAGALVITAWAIVLWPWGVLLLWPAVSLGIVAAGYFKFGSAIFRKVQGQVPFSTCFVLGPCLIGQHLSLLYYRRQCRAWDEVTPHVWIGRKLNDQEAATAIKKGVTAVLDLSAEFSEAQPFHEITYRNLPILDLAAPSLNELREMAEFIGVEATRGIVYVHCKIGYSRSAAAIAAYLIKSGQVSTAADAIAILRKARPTIVVRAEILSALRDFGEKNTK